MAFRTALARSDGIIVCGGLGPTQDDITREAIAEIMGVELVRDQKIVDVIARFFKARDRTMSANNARQADVPVGATIIPQRAGTAPGLICPLGNKVIYAVPGVPYEMAEMFERGILPDLRARMAEAGEEGVIVSRVLRTWGASESGLAEALQGRIDALDEDEVDGVPAGSVTLAFLASGIEGMKVRITARAATLPEGTARLDHEEKAVRAAIEGRLGDIVFGVDDESMEVAVATQLIAPRHHARCGGVAHRRAHCLTPGQRPRRLGLVPRGSGGVSRTGEVRRSWMCPLARSSPRPRRPPWPPGYAGSPGPTSASASPVWPVPTTRRGWARGPSSWGSGFPTARSRPGSSTSPATGNGCASTAPSRPWTSCAAPSSTWRLTR